MNSELIKEIIPNLSFEFPYDIDDYIENFYMENYHYHSSFSNTTIADSPSSNEDYAKQIVQNKSKCIFTGEHGNQGNQFEVYKLAEQYNLKYVHSTEAYWVKDRHKKDNSNCHICIIGLTANTREDINYILSIANEDGYYYRPRVDLELLFTLNPKETIITSACVAGWKYDDADEIWLKIAEYFGDNFFFEVQVNNTESQKELNQNIIKLSNKHNIQIICGLDSHYVNYNLDDIKREQILTYKKVHYPEEEGWNIDFPNSQEVYDRLKLQGVLNEREILTSIINTNVFVAKCGEIVFDKNFKIPCVYPNTTYEQRVQIFKNLLNERYREEKLKSNEKIEGIRYEVEQIVDSGVVDYFLTNDKILQDAINNEGGILTTTSRGSMASFITNKLLKFTTIDRFNSEIPIYPERFLTKERVKSGQMPDCDFNVAEQEPFVKASRNIIGEHSCYPLMAIEKLKEKASWQLYAGANGVESTVANEISKYIDKYNDKLKYTDEEDKPFIRIEDFIPSEYLDLYKKSLNYQGIIINLKVHACGFILLEGDVRRKIGLISAVSETTKKRTICACIEGGYLDEFGFVKNDFLIVDVVGLIKECFDSINQEVPTFDELREMIKYDGLTWGIYEKGIVCCVNQVEKDSTSKKAQRYKMKNLAESSAFIAGIRPGFASLLSNFLERKPYTTGEAKIDEILEDSYHYLIYQESIMKVLSFLGLSMGETYGVIKAISKKKYKDHPEKLEELKSRLKKGWIEQIGNLDNFNNVWQVIEDASRYSFNAPHSLSMGGDSAYIAWFKSHHPAEFYEVAINHYHKKDNKKKIDVLIEEANKFYGFEIGSYKFRKDNRKVNVDDINKIIYPNMSSIKDMQKIAPDLLYDAKDMQFNSILDFYKFLTTYRFEDNKLNSTSINILNRLDYFSEIGDINELLYGLEVYNKFATSKVITKSKLTPYELDCLQGCYGKETKSQYRELDNAKFMQNLITNANLQKATDYEKVGYELKYLGYSNIILPNEPPNICGVANVDIDQWNRPWVTLYRLCDGYRDTIKVDKKWFNDNKCEQGDILRCAWRDRAKMRKIGEDDEGKNVFEYTGEFEDVLKVYAVLN